MGYPSVVRWVVTNRHFAGYNPMQGEPAPTAGNGTVSVWLELNGKLLLNQQLMNIKKCCAVVCFYDPGWCNCIRT